MVDENEIPSLTELRRAARDYVALSALGDLTGETRAEFERWRARSPQHEEAYQEALGIWQALRPASASAQSTHRSFSRRRLFYVGAGAAATAGGLYAAGLVGVLPTPTQFLADHWTGIGERREVMLQTGVSVELDAGSALSIDDDGETTLQAGAAVFDLQKAKLDRPFVVKAGDLRCEADSALFEIVHAPGAVDVVCAKGKVAVIAGGRVTLQSGQRVSLSSTGLGEVGDASPDQMARWRTGLLAFQDRALGDVVADMNRYRQGRIIITSAAVGERRVGGVFDLKRPQDFVAQLVASFSLSVTTLPGNIALIS
ncbi:MAG: DUF4880 domain-containing protein [Pseudomonadota bacterium]